ncbi:MAG TPA: GNAT family N-acetyltransferase, partial [Actinomycetales bacterium]|nr:GNAT family N-acetyltransferase [Actinomycetales bacterium]
SVHARAWRTSYASLLPEQARTALEPADLAASWAQAISAPPTPRHEVLVATAEGQVVGFVALGPGSDADAQNGSDAEVVVLVVDPDAQGRGHGSRLLNAGVETLRAGGFTRITCWVPDADEARRRFLESAGFAADGATRVLDTSGDGSSTVRESRLATTLS